MIVASPARPRVDGDHSTSNMCIRFLQSFAAMVLWTAEGEVSLVRVGLRLVSTGWPRPTRWRPETPDEGGAKLLPPVPLITGNPWNESCRRDGRVAVVTNLR